MRTRSQMPPTPGGYFFNPQYARGGPRSVQAARNRPSFNAGILRGAAAATGLVGTALYNYLANNAGRVFRPVMNIGKGAARKVAGNLAGGYATSKVKQMFEKKSSSKKMTGIVSKSSGKFRKGRKFRPRKRHRMAAKGVSIVYEVSKLESVATQTMWIGHTSGPVAAIYDQMWLLILKRLMAKTGNSIVDFATTASLLTPGDIIQLEYQTTDGTLNTVTHSYATGQTWYQIFQTFANSSLLRASNVILKNIYYIPTVNAVGTAQDPGTARLNLEFSYIDLYCKSSMKLQNRTVGSSTDAENVDNVPLYGKLYSGNGTGINQYSRQGVAVAKHLVGDPLTGYILGDANDLGQQEPLPGLQLPRVSRVGKALLDPGQIKTNVLVYKKSFSVNGLRRILTEAIVAGRTRTPFGKYSIFALERMIQIGAPAANNIQIAMEINHFYTLNMRTKYRDQTSQQFSAVYL